MVYYYISFGKNKALFLKFLLQLHSFTVTLLSDACEEVLSNSALLWRGQMRGMGPKY